MSLTTAVSDHQTSSLFEVDGEQVGFMGFFLDLIYSPILAGRLRHLQPKYQNHHVLWETLFRSFNPKPAVIQLAIRSEDVK